MGSTNAKMLQMLHQAVIEDDADKVREILAVEEDLDLNARGEEDLTALQLAIVNGSLKSLQVIIESGRADVCALTADRQTPLILAAAKGQEDIALGFMELPEHLLHLDFYDSHDQQVLHYASAMGHNSLVAELLHRAPPAMGVDSVGGKLRHTPLMLAAQNGHDSVVRTLLEAGAQKSAIDLAKMTPLHHACMHGHESCVRVLLGESGEGVRELLDARDISGCTPLLYCVNNKDRILEKLLVSHGASLTEALDGGFSEYCYHTLQSSN